MQYCTYRRRCCEIHPTPPPKTENSKPQHHGPTPSANLVSSNNSRDIVWFEEHRVGILQHGLVKNARSQRMLVLCGLRPNPHRMRRAMQVNGTCWREWECPHCTQVTSKDFRSSVAWASESLKCVSQSINVDSPSPRHN